jgi:hypothetical protein
VDGLWQVCGYVLEEECPEEGRIAEGDTICQLLGTTFECASEDADSLRKVVDSGVRPVVAEFP